LKKIVISLFIFLFIIITAYSQEGFPFYGVRIGDTPEYAETILEKRGYLKTTEHLDENRIILEFKNKVLLAMILSQMKGIYSFIYKEILNTIRK